jgi:hypothetical protein
MDNRYFKYNCPALMNDGRFLTNYTRSSTFDQFIRNENNINSAQDYKNYLQQNGEVIMNNVKAYLNETNTCVVKGQCLPLNPSIEGDKPYKTEQCNFCGA